MKTVFFDLFETLVTDKTTRAYWTSTQEKLRTTQDRMSRWWLENTEGVMTGRFSDSIARFSNIRDEVGSPISDDEITEIAQEYESWRKGVLSTVDHQVVEMLDKVRTLGLGIGIISNANAAEVQAWDSCPLREHVDDVVFSFNVGVMKPNGKIYDLACARMGIQPSDAYFVGDGKFDELRGAASAGMKAIQAAWYQQQEVEWPWDHPLPRADSMADLPTMLI